LSSSIDPAAPDSSARKYPVGAEILPGGVHFRIWAPRRKRVQVVLEENPGPVAGTDLLTAELTPEENGYFSLLSSDAGAGSFYRFILDGTERFPDPASRYQPAGPHGSSSVQDPRLFRWTDDGWKGLTKEGAVFYEMHVGTFTPEGTWEAAARHLPELAELGVTAVEMMPVGEFAGRFGWGYDVVQPFAPTRLYGRPDDLRAFIDRAHSLGVGVILDVIYNHFGPEGNYFRHYSEDYFTDAYVNEWGDAINFDGANSRSVREFVLTNARYWIEEFHFDGLRLDATQQMFDNSPVHIISEIAEAARRVAGKRTILLVAECETQVSKLIRPKEDRGFGIDMVWNDDFHHSAQVAVTGYNEAYYSEYLGKPQELISAAKYGYLYQGQRYFWQKKRRGTPTRGIPRDSFITFIQNHDQIANSARGDRLHFRTSPGRFRAVTALLLLAPGTPMLFQGEEFCASSPFLYFADLNADIARLMRSGRVNFLKQFTNITSPEVLNTLDDPGNEATFIRSKLDHTEREKHREGYILHRDLLALRRTDPVFSSIPEVDGAVLGAEALVLRFSGAAGDRLLLVNFGRDLRLRPVPEPLLAPPEREGWEILWSSDSPDYGGYGTPRLETEECWRIPGHAAVVLAPAPAGEKDD
jgi:maltooligosyltrehalose trehalohydrolase